VAANGDNLATGDHVLHGLTSLELADIRVRLGFNTPGANDYAATKNDLENGQWPTDLACMSLV